MTKTHKFELTQRTQDLLSNLVGALEEETQLHRDVWDERSARWQQSEKGADVDTWIESLGDVLDQLEEVEESA